jgi:glycosyltransferase involved in cell wall biosynthesis
MPPVCTIVVPAFNAEDFLGWTLDSIATQTVKSFRCIIVNDGSTDSTPRIARRYADRDKRFRIITHQANSGLSAARNTGLRAAKSPFVTFLDADDLMMRDSLELRLAPLMDDVEKETLGSFCGSLTISEQSEKPPRSRQCKLRDIDFITSGTTCPFNANQPLFFTERLCRLGGFNEKLAQAEDFEFWMRALRAGYRCVSVNRYAVTYRNRTSSMVRQRPMTHLDTAIQLNKSAYLPLPPTTVFDSDIRPYLKPWPSYRQQADVAPRILSFVGMEAARRASQEPEIGLEDLKFRLAKELPDLQQVLGLENIRLHAKIGVARYHTLKPAELERILPQSTRIISDLVNLATKAESDSCNSVELAEFPFSDTVQFSGWNMGKTRNPSIIFLLQKDYHLDAVSSILNILGRKGITCHVVDLSSHCGDRGLRSKAAELDIDLVGLSPFMLGAYNPKLIVALNDWDPSVRAIFGAAQASGIKTVAIVEGIQDYWDADVNRDRGAYRMADIVLLPGQFDAKYFEDSQQKLAVGGVPRIEKMRKRLVTRPSKETRVLINSNFSYGVLVEHRDSWLEASVKACQDAGVDWFISRHPADLGTLHQEQVTTLSFEEATLESTVVIQRFASGILESLALGRPVIYFNPHDEKADKFADPMGAYPIATQQEELTELLKSAPSLHKLHAKAWPSFLDLHCSADENKSPDVAIADVLSSVFDEETPVADPTQWSKHLRVVDRFSRAMFETKKVLAHIRPTHARNLANEDLGKEGSFSERLQEVTEDSLITSAMLKAISEKELMGNQDLDKKTFLKKRLKVTLLRLDHSLEIFYHNTKNLPVFGTIVRGSSVVYDKIFK